MSDSHVSGTCMFRALCANMTVYDILKLLYQEVIDPDKFYTREERKRVLGEFWKGTQGLERKYTEKGFEEAIEKEMHYRDKSPMPRGYHEKPPEKARNFILKGGTTVVLGEYPGRAFQKFLEFFLLPSKLALIQKKKVLLPDKLYDEQVLHRVFKLINAENYSAQNLVKGFPYFLEVPDVKAIVGHAVEITKISQASEHNYTYSSKVARIREEVILAQKRTPPYVAKFFDVLLERVMNDHYIYEGSHFEKRMVLLDRLQQLPTATKGKGMVRNEFVIVNEKNRYEIDMESLRKAHLTLALMMDTAAGKEFRAEFVEHMQTTFPGRSEGKPTRSALLFAEKFFVWAASTLEFEKELVEPLRSMYTFGAVPPNKKINIRVIHMPGKVAWQPQTAYVFVEEINHALRKYQSTFGGLRLEPVPAPRPGPLPSILQFLDAYNCEEELQQLTGNRIVFDPVPLTNIQLGTIQLFPIPGPFNRHVTTPGPFIESITSILIDELKLGVSLDPEHPEVREFRVKMCGLFPVGKYPSLVDLQTMLDLKNEAHALKKYQTPPKNSRFLAGIQIEVSGLLASYPYLMRDRMLYISRISLIACFPELGQLFHLTFCSGDFCFMCKMPGFRPCFGPPLERYAYANPELVCDGLQASYQVATLREHLMGIE